MGKIIDINEHEMYRTEETICIKCFHRAITVYPESVLLKDLECIKCGTGYIILTGESL